MGHKIFILWTYSTLAKVNKHSGQNPVNLRTIHQRVGFICLHPFISRFRHLQLRCCCGCIIQVSLSADNVTSNWWFWKEVDTGKMFSFSLSSHADYRTTLLLNVRSLMYGHKHIVNCPRKGSLWGASSNWQKNVSWSAFQNSLRCFFFMMSSK